MVVGVVAAAKAVGGHSGGSGSCRGLGSFEAVLVAAFVVAVGGDVVLATTLTRVQSALHYLSRY